MIGGSHYDEASSLRDWAAAGPYDAEGLDTAYDAAIAPHPFRPNPPPVGVLMMMASPVCGSVTISRQTMNALQTGSGIMAGSSKLSLL